MDKAIIECKKVDIGYENHTIADSINFTLERGDMAVLIGANGSGKSTLLRTLCRLQPKINGSILLAGKELSAYSQRTLAKTISIVTTPRQGGGALSVTECVAIGRNPYTGILGHLTSADKQIIADAIAAVGLNDKAQRYMATLSDGERQKAMIARALAQQTPLIILDEPTAFLDVAGRRDIINLLKNLAANGKTILLSTHDIAPAISAANKLLVVAHNTIFAGDKNELIADGTLDLPFNNLKFNVTTGDYSTR